jgi:TM2 domain-containing membrane protein YozV
MPVAHKNKTFTTFLASVFGGLGAHRFYLYGWKDFWAWAHFLTVPISLLALAFGTGQPNMFLAGLFVLSVLIGFIEALVIGLTPDDKWDALHNPNSGKQSASGWPIALLLVLTMGVGATATIATIARAFDLLYTGGAYG